MVRGGTSSAGLLTAPRATSSACTRPSLGRRFAKRSRSSTSACALVSYSSCARPRIQAATQAEAAGAYYSPYYRRGGSTQKLLHRAGLDSLAPVPRAGLEPNLRRKKLSSGRAVTPHRLVLTKVFIPPRPNQYRRSEPKPRWRAALGQQESTPPTTQRGLRSTSSSRALSHFGLSHRGRASIVARRSKNDFMNRATGWSGGEIKREISAHRGRPEIACSHRP